MITLMPASLATLRMRLSSQSPISLDIKSMYTSIPPSEAIAAISHYLDKTNITPRILSKSSILDLLQCVLKNTYFQWNANVYRQYAGLAMGSRISGPLAILFIGRVEAIALRSTIRFSCFKRYVDDIFMLTSDTQEAGRILATFNSTHPTISFELERPSSEGALSLLDITVQYKNNSPIFDFYAKPAKTDLIIHCDSAMPVAKKLSVIKNERSRITERCSNPIQEEEHQANLDKRLRGHGYNKQFITQSRNKHPSRTSRTQHNNTTPFFLRTPYLGDWLDNRIRKVARDAGINVIISHPSTTLKQILRPKANRDEWRRCRFNWCSIQNNYCFRTMVVYKAVCDDCGSTYIGSTVREFHQRWREHQHRRESAVHQHMQTCNLFGQWTLSIIQQGRDPTDLRIREKLEIETQHPNLNTINTQFH